VYTSWHLQKFTCCLKQPQHHLCNINSKETKQKLCSVFLQSYFYNDDTFNFNYAQAKAAVGNFKESEEVSVNHYNKCHLQCVQYLDWPWIWYLNTILTLQFFVLYQIYCTVVWHLPDLVYNTLPNSRFFVQCSVLYPICCTMFCSIPDTVYDVLFYTRFSVRRFVLYQIQCTMFCSKSDSVCNVLFYIGFSVQRFVLYRIQCPMFCSIPDSVYTVFFYTRFSIQCFVLYQIQCTMFCSIPDSMYNVLFYTRFSVHCFFLYQIQCTMFCSIPDSVYNVFVLYQVFQLIQSDKIKNDYTYLSWLARCCKLPVVLIIQCYRAQTCHNLCSYCSSYSLVKTRKCRYRFTDINSPCIHFHSYW